MTQTQFKNSKKHNKRINNPFPSAPNSLPLIHAKLTFNHDKLSHARDFSIGNDFNLTWTPANGNFNLQFLHQDIYIDDETCQTCVVILSITGGFLSIWHRSAPDKIIWSTVPCEAFISGGAVETEVEESRGSFAIKDGEALFISKHQTIEKISALYNFDLESKGSEYDAIFGASYPDRERTHFPILVITGMFHLTFVGS